jgi:ABC-type sugar transport system, periplasmic component
LNWKDCFSQSELGSFVPDFLNDGTVDDKLCVFPVSKSTYMLFVAGGVFDRFAADKNVLISDLETWDGFFAVAEKFYDWSGGKPFCAIDYLIRLAELCAISNGAHINYKDDWYDTNNSAFVNAYDMFTSSIAKGHIVVSDMYSNTQVMTGQTCAGIGSSASILYYNDEITYPDNTSENMNLKVLPMPQQADKQKVATQAGVGLCAYKTTDRKAEAATVFARWFTEEQRNIDFVLSTGYMPVKTGAFDKIGETSFKSEAYKNLYNALSKTVATCTFEKEPNFDGYYVNVYALYDKIRNIQKELNTRYEAGETCEQIVEELRVALNIVA